MFGIYYERKITLELWQLYDSVGNETGKIIEANSEIPEGLYHKTVSVWIKNKKEQYLMSKRSPENSMLIVGNVQVVPYRQVKIRGKPHVEKYMKSWELILVL